MLSLSIAASASAPPTRSTTTSHCIDGVGVAERVEVTDAVAVVVIVPETVAVRESVPVGTSDREMVCVRADVADAE